MADDEFVMTYPCYFPLTAEGNPELIQVDDALCVCLFTDRKLVETFYNDKYRDRTKKSVPVLAWKSAPELLKFLKNSRPAFEFAGCRFVAVNIVPGKQPMFCPYADLVVYLGG